MRQLHIENGPVRHLGFSADGQRLFAAVQHGRTLWWGQADQELEPMSQLLQGERVSAFRTAIRQDHFALARVPSLQAGRSVIEIRQDSPPFALLTELSAQAQRTWLGFTRQGDRLWSNTRMGWLAGALTCWELPSGRQCAHLSDLPAGTQVYALAPDDRTLALGDGQSRIRFLDLLTGEERRGLGGWLRSIFSQWGWSIPRVPQSTLLHRTRIIRDLAFSANGAWVAAATGHSVMLRHIAIRPEEQQMEALHEQDLRGHRRLVEQVAFTPDSRYLATASRDGEVRFWALQPGQLCATYAWEIGRIYRIAFAPDGLRIAAGGDDGRIVLWDMDDLLS